MPVMDCDYRSRRAENFDTICDSQAAEALPALRVDEPTVTMTFPSEYFTVSVKKVNMWPRVTSVSTRRIGPQRGIAC